MWIDHDNAYMMMMMMMIFYCIIIIYFVQYSAKIKKTCHTYISVQYAAAGMT